MKSAVVALLLGAAAAGITVAGRSADRLAARNAARARASARAAEEARVRDLDIAFFTRRVAEDSLGARDLQQLAALHLARARAHGDPADLRTATVLAQRSLAHRQSRNAGARLVLANALMGEHDFVAALAQADTLVADDPIAPSRRALRAEILLELGRYADAQTAYASLHATRGDPSMQARRARWEELRGRPDRARQLLDSAAVEAAAGFGVSTEQRSWFALRQGDLALRTGRLRDAARALAVAEQAAPDDARIQLSWARLAGARGDAAAQARHAGAALATQPSPEAMALMEAALRHRGDSATARRWADALELQARAADGTVHRGIALHLLSLQRAVPLLHAAAEADLKQRRDVYAWDLAAAARLAVGDTAGAALAADSAVRLGTADAALLARAAEAAAAAGDTSTARLRLARAFAITAAWDLDGTARARVLRRRLGN